jgi:hypothetical protein
MVAMVPTMAKKGEQDQRLAGMVGRTGKNRTCRPNGTELDLAVVEVRWRLLPLGSTAAAFRTALLNGRARNITVRAIDAAVALLGLEHCFAVLAFVEPLASVGRHGLDFYMAAMWTGQR